MPVFEFLTCPYDKSHKIREDRVQYHLVRCREKHPELDLAVCSFNATHHVPRDCMEDHLAQCPSRYVAEIRQFSQSTLRPGMHGDLTLPTLYGASGMDSGEVRRRNLCDVVLVDDSDRSLYSAAEVALANMGGVGTRPGGASLGSSADPEDRRRRRQDRPW